MKSIVLLMYSYIVRHILREKEIQKETIMKKKDETHNIYII